MKVWAMSPELKQKWIAALRSGEYIQGKETLYNARADTYCCLGVLCRVAGIEIGDANEGGCLKSTVRRQLRLPIAVHDLAFQKNDGSSSGRTRPVSTFPEIADWLEKRL